MISKHDSKIEQELFDSGKVIKGEVVMRATDQTDAVYRHIPDCVYYDDRVKGIVFVNLKDGNFPSTDGARGGKRSAENKKRSYLQNDRTRFSKKRRDYARAHLGWNHSMYQGKTFLESWLPFFPVNRVYYLYVCRGINRSYKTDARVQKQVDKFKGFGHNFQVLDVPDFLEWVADDNVSYVDFGQLTKVHGKTGEVVPFTIDQFPIEKGESDLKIRFELPPHLYHYYTDNVCPFVEYEHSGVDRFM